MAFAVGRWSEGNFIGMVLHGLCLEAAGDCREEDKDGADSGRNQRRHLFLKTVFLYDKSATIHKRIFTSF
jgi:hypothetical protein